MLFAYAVLRASKKSVFTMFALEYWETHPMLSGSERFLSKSGPKPRAVQRSFPAGKIGIIPTKPASSQEDLSLAYTPGVAAPSLAIADNPETAYDYTGKGNLVAVISNGTAVLGLGNIGAAASKPVMEGKALLFKILGGIDAFDIEVDATEPEQPPSPAPTST